MMKTPGARVRCIFPVFGLLSACSGASPVGGPLQATGGGGDDGGVEDTDEPQDPPVLDTVSGVDPAEVESAVTGPVHYGPEVDCGERISPADTGLLSRWPIIQRVTKTEAVVIFGTSGAAEVRVRWGTDDTYPSSAGAVSREIPLDSEDSDTATVAGTQVLHEVQLSGLEAGGQVCYKVEVDGETAVAGMRFRTAPESALAPVRFIAMGDFGNGTATATAVHDAMAAHLPGTHFLFTLGDNAYNRGDWDELQANVFELYQDQWMELPVFPTPGNHDYGTELAAPYYAAFALPENALKSEDNEKYWSTDWGALHLVGLNTERPADEHSEDDPADQLDWLQADLDANTLPWVVAGWHKPAVSAHRTRDPDPNALDGFVPILEDHGAQLVLQGHNHFYERYAPMHAFEATPLSEGGTVYVVSGGGGAHVYPLDEAENQEVAREVNHFTVVEISACTITIQAIASDGVIFDEWSESRCE